MELNFEKVKAFSAVTFIQLICGVIVPGFLFLFIFKRDLFQTLDLFRLSTLAISVTAPILTVNGILILVMMTYDDKESPDEEQFHRNFAATIYLGSILTIMVIYACIIIGYFFNLTLRQGVLTLIISEAILLISFIIIEVRSKKSDEKSIKK